MSTVGLLLAATPAVACSCAGGLSMKEYATAETVIFTGTTGPQDARGVPVRVTEWFHGPTPQAIVYIGKESFGQESSCGTNAPPAGTDWIFVGYLPGQGADPVTGLCSPHYRLDTDEGARFLDDARAFFTGVPPPEPSSAPTPAAPAPTETPTPTTGERPLDPGLTAGTYILGSLGAGLLVLLGAVMLARRRPRGAG
jgi:hypothetical protein